MTKQEFIDAAAEVKYANFTITNQDGRFFVTSETGLKFDDRFGGTSFAEADAPAGLIAEYERRLDGVVSVISDLI